MIELYVVAATIGSLWGALLLANERADLVIGFPYFFVFSVFWILWLVLNPPTAAPEQSGAGEKRR